MALDFLTVRPPRCLLVNLHSGEELACLFNPSELSERVQVNWNRVAVPGLSHQVLQYQGTANRQLPNVEFYLDRILAAEEPGASDILAFRDFLRALTVPPADARSVLTNAPPRLLFLWPDVLTIECVVASVDFHYRRIGADGQVLVYAATCAFEEILDERVTSEDLREGGTLHLAPIDLTGEA